MEDHWLYGSRCTVSCRRTDGFRDMCFGLRKADKFDRQWEATLATLIRIVHVHYNWMQLRACIRVILHNSGEQ